MFEGKLKIEERYPGSDLGPGSDWYLGVVPVHCLHICLSLVCTSFQYSSTVPYILFVLIEKPEGVILKYQYQYAGTVWDLACVDSIFCISLTEKPWKPMYSYNVGIVGTVSCTGLHIYLNMWLTSSYFFLKSGNKT